MSMMIPVKSASKQPKKVKRGTLIEEHTTHRGQTLNECPSHRPVSDDACEHCTYMHIASCLVKVRHRVLNQDVAAGS